MPKIKDWTCAKKLGDGRNADVWEASHSRYGTCALKILRNIKPNTEPYKRFKAEIVVLKSLERTEGILPLLADNLPDNPSKENPAWLAMPVATLILKALDGKTLKEIVAAIASIAGDLSRLHVKSIYHRDIKPNNLYYLDKAYLIGDFGLVDYPDKEGLTETNKQLGPRYYLAPEMLSNPMKAAGGPADVYSLSKTLWVIATGQTFPVQGEQRIDVPQLGIRSYRGESKMTTFLDRLIERATRHEPTSRPTMAEFEEELLEILDPELQKSIEPLNEVGKILAMELLPHAQIVSKNKLLLNVFSPLAQRLFERIKSAGDSITNMVEKKLGELNYGLPPGPLYYIDEFIHEPIRKDIEIDIQEKCIDSIEYCLRLKALNMCYQINLYVNGKIAVTMLVHERHTLWKKFIISDVGTAKAEKEVDKLFNEMEANFLSAVKNTLQ